MAFPYLSGVSPGTEYQVSRSYFSADRATDRAMELATRTKSVNGRERVFNDQQLRDFMEGFYGYENLKARYYLVGKEEGGGNTLADVQARLNAWEALSRPEFADLAEFHEKIGRADLVKQNPTRQATWEALMKLVLSAEGKEHWDPTRSRLDDYQATRLGRSGDRTLLTELLPLPSPSADDWFYSRQSHLPELCDGRDAYFARVAPWRAQRIKKLVDTHKPDAVIFYSTKSTYRTWWEWIAAPASFKAISASDIQVARRDDTVFMIVEHPGTCPPSGYYLEAGRILDLEIKRRSNDHYCYSNPGRAHSLYRRFWQGLLKHPRTRGTAFSTLVDDDLKPNRNSELRVQCRGPHASFVYALSIAGRGSVSQFDIPQSDCLASKLTTLPIYEPDGPFVRDVSDGFLRVKRVFPLELVDERKWPDLQQSMIDAMIDLEQKLAPYLST